MTDVVVVILHPEPPSGAGPLERAVAAAREAVAQRHRDGFIAAGATAARIATGPSGDGRSFGERLREIAKDLRGDEGLVVLGSGAIPLATARDRASFVAAAGAGRPGALANDRFSADIVAIACARDVVGAVPDLPSDNGLPRWLADAGVPVADLRSRWQLGFDIDGPLDLLLLGQPWATGLAGTADLVSDRLVALRSVVADRAAELVVTGRTSATALRWLERNVAARTRALVEERGMRTAIPGQRPPASVLGALLDRDGPGAIGAHLARLGDAALVDTRVLLAHRLGADVRTWPSAEDRFSSDQLLVDAVTDPWLRELTRSAADASIPVVLGGHTLVGPGLRLAVRAGI